MFAANSCHVSGAYPAYRYWRLQVTAPTTNVSISEWRITEQSLAISSLAGKAITVLTGDFTTHPITAINDGVTETANATNIANAGAAVFDIYVDLGAAYAVTAFKLAPQGTAGASTFNEPTAFKAYGSADASAWDLRATFTGISTGFPNWNAGTFRTFSW